MSKETLLSGLGGVLIGIVLTSSFPSLLLWRVSGWYGNSMMGPVGGMMGGGMMGGAIDSHFIEQMIPHHEDAILMAEIALTKAEHAEIKSLAQDIKRTQSEEIALMKKWYQAWYGSEVRAFTQGGRGMMMQMGMMGDATDIGRLETAASFDKAFIEEMIPHHQMAVMMAQMLARTTGRSEMRELAEDIIEAQTREINSMRSWYREWYNQ